MVIFAKTDQTCFTNLSNTVLVASVDHRLWLGSFHFEYKCRKRRIKLLKMVLSKEKFEVNLKSFLLADKLFMKFFYRKF